MGQAHSVSRDYFTINNTKNDFASKTIIMIQETTEISSEGGGRDGGCKSYHRVVEQTSHKTETGDVNLTTK